MTGNKSRRTSPYIQFNRLCEEYNQGRYALVEEGKQEGGTHTNSISDLFNISYNAHNAGERNRVGACLLSYHSFSLCLLQFLSPSVSDARNAPLVVLGNQLTRPEQSREEFFSLASLELITKKADTYTGTKVLGECYMIAYLPVSRTYLPDSYLFFSPSTVTLGHCCGELSLSRSFPRICQEEAVLSRDVLSHSRQPPHSPSSHIFSTHSDSSSRRGKSWEWQDCENNRQQTRRVRMVYCHRFIYTTQ